MARRQLKYLEKQVARLQNEIHDLTDQHGCLHFKIGLIECWAEGLQCYRKAAEKRGVVLVDPLSQEEHEFLRNYGTMGRGIRPLQHLGVETLAPPLDPMKYWRDMLQHGPMQEATDMTVQQLTVEMQTTISQLAILLNKLKIPSCHAETLYSMNIILYRYLHLLSSLMEIGKQKVIAIAVGYRLDTLESGSGYAEQALQHTLMVGPHLGLTEEQQRIIAAGTELQLSLLEDNRKEQQQIKDTLAAADIDDASSCNLGAHRDFEGLASRALQLDERQQLYRRLQVLLQKENMMQSVHCGWLTGCLSCEQMSLAHVLAWPYILRLSHLGLAVQQWYRKRTGTKPVSFQIPT